MTSQLNYDLYRFSIKDSSDCQCGNTCENVHHFLLDCKFYNVQREKLMSDLKHVIKLPITLSLMLRGDPHLSTDQNEFVFNVYKPIFINQNVLGDHLICVPSSHHFFPVLYCLFLSFSF